MCLYHTVPHEKSSDSKISVPYQIWSKKSAFLIKKRQKIGIPYQKSVFKKSVFLSKNQSRIGQKSTLRIRGTKSLN